MAERQILEEKSYKVVYREGTKVVKSFVPSHPKADVFNEAYIHACAEESGVSVPRIIGVSPNEEGGWDLSMEYVEGKTLAQLMEEAPEKEEEYLSLLIDIQLEVASHRARKLRHTKAKMAEAVNALSEIDASTRYELLKRISGMRDHTKLCHGDLVPSNIVLREDGSWCVLDWSHATQGNAGADAAITYLRFSLVNPERAERYLKLYCKKADMAIQYIQTWMPVVAAAQLTKHRPEEKDLLERWISVAEYQ